MSTKHRIPAPCAPAAKASSENLVNLRLDAPTTVNVALQFVAGAPVEAVIVTVAGTSGARHTKGSVAGADAGVPSLAVQSAASSLVALAITHAACPGAVTGGGAAGSTGAVAAETCPANAPGAASCNSSASGASTSSA